MNFISHLRGHRRHFANVYRFTTNANRRLRHLDDVHDMLFETFNSSDNLVLRNCSFATSKAHASLPFWRNFIALQRRQSPRLYTCNKFSKCFITLTRGSHSANTPSPSNLSRFNIPSPRHDRHQFDGASSVLLP